MTDKVGSWQCFQVFFSYSAFLGVWHDIGNHAMVLKQTIHQKVNRSILKYCYLEIQLTNNLFSEKWTSLSHISNGPFKTFSKVLFSKTATITVVENKPKKSYSTLRAKRATLTFWVDKSWIKMPKIVNFASLIFRPNSVTR